MNSIWPARGAAFPADATDFDDFREGGWNARRVGIILVLVVLGELCLLLSAAPVDALPAIAAHYRTPHAAWVASTYFLVAALVSPITGTLADRYGKRRLLVLHLVLAIVGLLISAVAPTFAILLVGRVLQAPVLTFAFLLPSLVRDIFPTRTIPLAASVAVTGAGMLGIAVQLYGGDVVGHLGFRSVFWLPAVAAAPVLAALVLLVPESGVRQRRGRIDLLGAALLGGGVALALGGVSHGPASGWTSLRVLTCLTGAVVLLAAWVFEAMRVGDPLIDLREVISAPLLTAMLFAGLGTALGAWLFVVLPVIARTPADLGGLGLNPSQQTQLSAVFLLGGSVAGFVAGYALRRRAAGTVAIAAMVLLTAGYALAYLGRTSTPAFAAATLAIGMGGGVGLAVACNLVIKLVAPERQAVMSSTFTLFFTLLASAVSVVLFAAVNHLGTAPPATSHLVYGRAAFKAAMLIPMVLSLIAVAAAVGLRLTRAGRGARKQWRQTEPVPVAVRARRLTVVES